MSKSIKVIRAVLKHNFKTNLNPALQDMSTKYQKLPPKSKPVEINGKEVTIGVRQPIKRVIDCYKSKVNYFKKLPKNHPELTTIKKVYETIKRSRQ